MAAEFVIGLDIGSYSIKAVILSHRNKKPRLLSYGLVPTPQPGLNAEAGTDLSPIAKAITSLLAALKSPGSLVVVALPESKIFTRIVSDFPFLTDQELASAIKYSAEEFVPLPADQVNLNWYIVNRSKQQNSTAVFVIASPKSTVEKYVKILDLSKLRALAVETELVAASRAIIGSNELAPTTLIVQFGATSTNFAVVSRGLILLTRSVATGGMALTRAIAQDLNFEITQAEEYKKVYGLIEDQLEGKIYQVLKPLVDVIIAEGQRIIQAFQTKNPQERIKRIVLSGGGAKLPGLVVYLANNLGLEIQEADAWALIDKDASLQNKLINDSTTYTIAAGLALRTD